MTGNYDEHDRQRYQPEAGTSIRGDFARDRARVLHSAALRRLAAKTQVMVAGSADFPRTRLTHTLEVAQIARELGHALGCDADIVDIAGLAHDLGHPPYGHNGEDALDLLADSFGGFEGNAQSLRILTRLEAKSLDPVTGASAGLNLTRASLDAACKYPWPRRDGQRKFGVYADDLPMFSWLREGAPDERTCLEEQVMDWADDVAYSVHDVEDAIHGGHVDLGQLSSGQERTWVVDTAAERYGIDPGALTDAVERLRRLDYWPVGFDGSMQSLAHLKRFTSSLIGRLCTAAQQATQAQYGTAPLVRYDANLIVPDEIRAEVAVMKAIAVAYVMNREGAEAQYQRQQVEITELYHALVLDGGRSLEAWLKPDYDLATTDAERNRVIVDQIASLTDVSIVAWHQRLVRR